MKSVRRVQYWSILLCFSAHTISLFLLTSPVVSAQGLQAQIRSITGRVELRSKSRPGIFAIKPKDRLEPGSIIVTGNNGRVVISLDDGSQVTVFPNSRVVLKDYPAVGSVREFLEIQLGRVLVKIYHSGGKPNPYRLNSPSASIAVRGTEFIVDVLQNGETLVAVQEGQVEVWPHNNPGNKRLITPGGSVIVRPGGDISLAFPGPGGELNGRVRFNRTLEGEYQHSVDSLVQNSINIPPVFFSAFSDSHLDSLENPAYACEFEDAEGRLSLLPSISRPYFMDEDHDSFDYSISPQLTFFTPIPGSRLTVGGSVSTPRTRLQTLTNFGSPESNYSHYDKDNLRFGAHNVSLIAAYGLGAHGRTSVGIGIDNLSGAGSYFRESSTNSDISDGEHRIDSNVRFGRTRLTFGLFHKLSDSKKIGIYYRHGINSSYHEARIKSKFESMDYPAYFYDISQSGEGNISTASSEVGVRFRARLTRRLIYGIEGSYLYERINSRVTTTNLIQANIRTQANDRDLARRARLGVGAGFAITPRILLGVDFTGGMFNTTKPTEDSLWSFYFFEPPSFGYYYNSPVHERGAFLSSHAMVQANTWRNLFVSASSLTTFRKTRVTYSGREGNPYGYGEKSYLTNVGMGWRFKPNLFAEYLFSIDHTNRRPSHSLMLRYTFNLGIKNEK
jgi:FecR protein